VRKLSVRGRSVWQNPPSMRHDWGKMPRVMVGRRPVVSQSLLFQLDSAWHMPCLRACMDTSTTFALGQTRGCRWVDLIRPYPEGWLEGLRAGAVNEDIDTRATSERETRNHHLPVGRAGSAGAGL
jgi:hypothetical protein